MITDSRYFYQARLRVRNAEVLLAEGSFFTLITELILASNTERLGFEERSLDFAQYRIIKKLLAGRTKLEPTAGLVEELRKIKDPQEIVLLKKATRAAAEALRFAAKLIRPGLREIQIAAELRRFIAYKAAMSTAFDIIVASGINSSFAHHLTSEKKLKNGELLFIDIGTEYLGYKSDLTRTFFLGKIAGKPKKIYDIVRKAAALAIKKIAPGTKISEIDSTARQHIASFGYGGFFGHNLGHGIGLEIHEEPAISEKNQALLKEGMVFSVEPAIYLPGEFGIRIEDDVLVTKNGCEVLSGNLTQ